LKTSPHFSAKRGETFSTDSKARKFSEFFYTQIELVKLANYEHFEAKRAQNS
jgi:hypothetical protein